MNYNTEHGARYSKIIIQSMVLGIRKFPGSSLGPKTAYYKTGFSNSPHSVQVYVEVLL